MTSPTARVQKAIRKPSAARTPKPVRRTHDRATVIFRDFVRQLEKLDGRPARNVGKGSL
jgi:hypothetical protein